MKSVHPLCHWYSATVVLVVVSGLAIGAIPISAQSGSATSSATPSNATPDVGEQIEVTIGIDVTGVEPPDSALGSFTSSLDWDPAVLAYASHSGVLAGFTGVVNDAQALSGHLVFNGAKTTGATGAFTVLSVTFDVIGVGSSALDLEYSAMAAAVTFNDLLPLFTIDDGHVDVGPDPLYSLTIAVDPAESGTTDPEVGDHTYAADTVVGITAVPAAGYAFDHWSGACTGSGSCQVIMDADKAVTAHLTALPLTCYALTLGHEGYGSDPVADPIYSTGCPAGQYLEGETINLSGAIPDAGWQVRSWIGTSQDESMAGTNSLTMPAGAHTVSVLYRTHLYLPIILDGVVTNEPTLSRTIVEENRVIAPTSPNPETKALDTSLPQTRTQPIVGEQDSTVEPAIVEENTGIAPTLPSPDAAALDSSSTRVAAAQVTEKRDLTIDSPTSRGNDSTHAIDESPLHRVPDLVRPFSYMLLFLFVLLMFFMLILRIVRERSANNE